MSPWLIGGWSISQRSACDGDFAHEQGIEVWSKELVVGMVAAMADAGARGPRDPVWRAGNQVLVEFDVQFIARRSEHERTVAFREERR